MTFIIYKCIITTNKRHIDKHNILLCGNLNIDSINQTNYKYYEKLMELFPNGKDSFAPQFTITNPPDTRVEWKII